MPHEEHDAHRLKRAPHEGERVHLKHLAEAGKRRRDANRVDVLFREGVAVTRAQMVGVEMALAASSSLFSETQTSSWK